MMLQQLVFTITTLAIVSAANNPLSQIMLQDHTHAYEQTRFDLEPMTRTSFYLKTRLHYPNPMASDKDGLYLGSYHTGAGLNDAVLRKSKTMKGYLNGTRLMLEPYDDIDVQYGLRLTTNSPGLPAWQTVQIDATRLPTSGLKIDAGGRLIMNTGEDTAISLEWGAWLVCDWVYSVPQLFWWTRRAVHVTLPPACEWVDLVKEDP